jgi:hypothetical protein
LGEKYPIEFDIISKPKSEYETDEYFALDQPVAPAVMVGDDIVVEGSDVSEHDLEVFICSHLGLPEPEKKGMLGRFFKKSKFSLLETIMFTLRVFLNDPRRET